MLFGLIPREEAFFELFKKAAHNMIEGSRLLKVMMEDFRSPIEQAKEIKAVEHIGDDITHDIARRLNMTFITPIDREDIHDLASALDDILDTTEAIADRFVLYKIPKPTEKAIKLADILYQASVAVGQGVDLLGLPHPGCGGPGGSSGRRGVGWVGQRCLGAAVRRDLPADGGEDRVPPDAAGAAHRKDRAANAESTTAKG